MSYKCWRRQFLICKGRIAPDESWRHLPLRDGWGLSYQEDLGVREHLEADGRTALVLGEAWGLESLEAGAAGRYAVIDWPHVRSDRAGAVLSLFHGGTGDGTVISSNAGLAAAVLRGLEPGIDDEAEPDYQAVLRHRALMNYIPAPGTRYREVRRLFRDQRIAIPTGETERCSTPILPLGSHEQAVEVVASELTRFAHALRERVPGRIHLQLTAGLDSRTVLAAFLYAGIPFETVTLRSPVKPKEDELVARQISTRMGLRHSVSDLRLPPNPAFGEIYRRQTSGGMNAWDETDLFPGDIYRFLVAGDAMVGGLCFELGRQTFGPVHLGVDLANATGADLWRRLARQPEAGPPEFVACLDNWLAWRRADPYPFNFVSTHYLDQRLGAWAATLMAGYDLMPGLTVHPANNPRIFAALVTPDTAEQSEGRLQLDVIRALAPDLLAFPINPVPMSRQVRQFLNRARRTARALLPAE